MVDPIRLEVFKHLFAAIAEEMGVVLRKASYSPNIKERRDYSCALFDQEGDMVSQAAHIPVHLGSMPLSIAAAIRAFEHLAPDDTIILNDPYQGGTHLPDITLVTPVFVDRNGELILFGFVASRAHHADVGGMSPGSMGISKEIYQEGLIIPPSKLIEAGNLNQGLYDIILANVRTPQERSGDLWAQIAANQRGTNRLLELIARYGKDTVSLYMAELMAYTERVTRKLLQEIPDGSYRFTDSLDDDGISSESIPICVDVTIQGDQAIVDFSNSAPQSQGSMNAVYAITLSAVNYVFRSLIGLDLPNNAGCMIPIQVIAPEGTIVNARKPAPVAGGNVETSQRIVDVLLGALSQATPDKIPAASQGSMNNLTIGGWDEERNQPYTYYETIAGGTGAYPNAPGIDAIHSHMTNTLNTPIEALEYTYPLHVEQYSIRRDSGGSGAFQGGNGLRRDIRVLGLAQVNIISERRKNSPYGLAGGSAGMCGENILIRADQVIKLPGKGSFELQNGDIISIRTPGGGGFGAEG